MLQEITILVNIIESVKAKGTSMQSKSTKVVCRE